MVYRRLHENALLRSFKFNSLGCFSFSAEHLLPHLPDPCPPNVIPGRQVGSRRLKGLRPAGKAATCISRALTEHVAHTMTMRCSDSKYVFK